MYFTLESFIEYCKTPVCESVGKFSYIDRTLHMAYEADDAQNTDNIESSNKDNNVDTDNSDENIQKACEAKVKNIQQGTKAWWQSLKEWFANFFKTDAQRRREAVVGTINNIVGQIKENLSKLAKNKDGEYDEASIDRVGNTIGNLIDQTKGLIQGLINKFHVNPDGTSRNETPAANNNNNNQANNNQNQNNNNASNNNTQNNQNNGEKKEDIIKDSNKASKNAKDNSK